MRTFEEFSVSLEICKVIGEMGYESPMPVQEETIPYLLGESNDVITLARTGVGKTAVFGLPLTQKTNVESRIPRLLVLCPTRELCLWIAGNLNDYSKYIDGLKVLSVYGDLSIGSQIRSLKWGVHIITATSGRLLDLMERKTVSLVTIANVVMDRAGEMLNMGFIESINTTLTDVPQECNTLLFSTTMSPEIARISKNHPHDAKEIVIGRKNESTSSVKYVVCTAHAKDRYVTLKRIVDYHPQIYGIVFCRTRKGTQGIADKSMQEDYNADSLHGEFSQAQRDTVTQKFRIRNLQILIATDVATCGLDVDDLTYVINYGLPDDTESYTHRSGRTGHTDRTGTPATTINLREKERMRETERIVGEKFIAGKMPTGKQICEKQLLKMIDDLGKVRVNKGDINDFMSEACRRLEWLSKEDLIKCMVSYKFNRFVDYYRSREEIEVLTDSCSKRVIKNHDGKGGRQAELGFIRLFISLGGMDNSSPHELITLFNNNTCGRVEPGRTDLMKNSLLFEVEEKQAQDAIKALNWTNWNGRRVMVKVAGGEAPMKCRERGRWSENSDKGGKGRDTAALADREDRGRAGKDGRQADTRKAQKLSREGRGYSVTCGPKGKDERKQLFKDAEPDFSEGRWVRRKPKKN